MVEGHAELINKTFSPYIFPGIKTNYDCHVTIIRELQKWLAERGEELLLRSDFLSQIDHYSRHYRTFLSQSLLMYTYRKMIMQKHIKSHPLMWKFLKERKREGEVKEESVLYVEADEDPFEQITSFLADHRIDRITVIVRAKRRVSRQFVKSLVYAVNSKDRILDSNAGGGCFEHLDDEWCFNRSASVKIVDLGIEPRSRPRPTDFAAYAEFGFSMFQIAPGPLASRDDASAVVQLAKASGLKVRVKIAINKLGSSFVADVYHVDEHMSGPLHYADEVTLAVENETASTVMERWHNSPKYVPYTGETSVTLFAVMKYALLSCAPWMRLRCEYGSSSEMVSVESSDILRVLTQEMEELGVRVQCIERRMQAAEEAPGMLHFFTSECINEKKSEYFISGQSEDGKGLSGFIRLYVPSDGGLALIREMKAAGTFARNKMLDVAEATSKMHNSTGIATRCMGRQALLEEGFESEGSTYTKRFGVLTRLYHMLPNIGSIFPE